MSKLAARVARVHRVLSRVAKLRTAKGVVDSGVAEAFYNAVNKLKHGNVHVKDVKVYEGGIFGDAQGSTQAHVVIEPDSYTTFGIDPKAKPAGYVFVSLEPGPLDNGILELDVSCGRSHVLVDIKKGKAPRVVKRTPQVTKNLDALAMGLAQTVSNAYTRQAMTKTSAKKPVVKFKPFDKPRIYGDNAFAHILLDGEYAGEIVRVMDVEYVGMGRTYKVDGYEVTLNSDRLPEYDDTKFFPVFMLRPKRPGSPTAREALKAAKEWVRSEIGKALGAAVAVEDTSKPE